MTAPTSGDTRPHVVVIGAGAVGLCCAHYLERRGATVTVLERDAVGHGCSLGNAGWLCPMDAHPLPAPGVRGYALRSLFDRSSALHVKPARLPGLAPWLVRFWLRCDRRHYVPAHHALAHLGQATFPLITEMQADGVEFELHRKGMVFATGDAELARATLSELQPMREYGYAIPTEVLLEDDLRAVEPSLSSSIAAGFVIEDHWHVSPESFTTGLASSLRSRGAEILERTNVHGFVTDGDRIRAARSDRGDVEADGFVVACGVWSTGLARQLQARLPLQAGKGYSFSVVPSVVPRHAVDLPDVRVGCSPFGERMRVAGTMELDGLRTRIDGPRLQQVVAGARASFRPWESAEIADVWAGLRPVTVDGLPVIDRAPAHSNAYIAAGHGMLGIHLAAPTGAALSELVITGRRPEVIEPFRLDRFARTRGLTPRGRWPYGSAE